MNKKNKGKHKFIIFLFILVVLIIIALVSKDYVLRYMYPQKYSEFVEKYSREYDLDKNLVYSIIKAESSFNPEAISPSDAKGLMQIMDSTGEWAAKKIKIKDFNSRMLIDPQTNIRIGCWYISSLLNQYKQDVDLALSAYNAGSGNVEKWLNDINISSDGKTLDRIPFVETNNYIKRIKKYKIMYDKLYIDNK